MIVAIDGPAGSGKSTVARAVARDCGFTYLDTGAMYRSVALAALEGGVDLDDAGALEELARKTEVVFGRDEQGGQTVFAAGRNVTAAIRTPEVDAVVSKVSLVPGVRAVMVGRQRAIAGQGGDAVAEGRDIGTVVFPEAEVKVFLTASPRTRAQRRADQNRARDAATAEQVDEDSIYAAIVERDRIDSSRANSPLIAADDAVQVDSSELGVDEVVARVEALIAEARAGNGRQTGCDCCCPR